jgi:hypothetical protein
MVCDKPILDVIRENETDPDSYALVMLKGDEAIFIFEGDPDLLLQLVPQLQEKIEAAAHPIQ